MRIAESRLSSRLSPPVRASWPCVPPVVPPERVCWTPSTAVVTGGAPWTSVTDRAVAPLATQSSFRLTGLPARLRLIVILRSPATKATGWPTAEVRVKAVPPNGGVEKPEALAKVMVWSGSVATSGPPLTPSPALTVSDIPLTSTLVTPSPVTIAFMLSGSVRP
jgi:hypothetical protein